MPAPSQGCSTSHQQPKGLTPLLALLLISICDALLTLTPCYQVTYLKLSFQFFFLNIKSSLNPEEFLFTEIEFSIHITLAPSALHLKVPAPWPGCPSSPATLKMIMQHLALLLICVGDPLLTSFARTTPWEYRLNYYNLFTSIKSSGAHRLHATSCNSPSSAPLLKLSLLYWSMSVTFCLEITKQIKTDLFYK